MYFRICLDIMVLTNQTWVLIMNRVTVSLIPYGPYVLDYKSGMCNYIDNVILAVDKLNDLGYSFTLNDMGKSFFVNVR